MNRRQKKLESVFNGLLRKGICPEKITANALFLYSMECYLNDEIDIVALLDRANKINIIAGGKYNESVVMEA